MKYRKATRERRLRKYYSLYGHLLNRDLLYSSFRKVKSNKGAAGTDRQSLSDFERNLDAELSQLLQELKAKTYKAQAVRRVIIPKPDGGERVLGIPSVRDRVVQQAVKSVLEPLFDPCFHPSSYGYRPGRGCHDAIEKTTMFIRDYHRQWVVDMDLSRCFDTLDHDLLISAVKQRVTDGSILTLLREFLSSGIMAGDVLSYQEKGSPQGGIISPLLANIYLDSFDQEMKRRGHRIVRYADDILILCCSERGAFNALAKATALLEVDLKLTVNRKKTSVVHSDDGVSYLGVEIGSRYTRIQPKKLRILKDKVRELTKRNGGCNLVTIVTKLNPVLRGFAHYFKIANCYREMKSLSGWVRRRLRAIQLKLWKKPGRLHRRLRQLGYKGPFKFIKMNSWRNARSPLASFAMPNSWFDSLGLFRPDGIFQS